MINKKAEVAIVLLVLMTLLLAGTTLFIFNINLNRVETKIINIKNLEEIYVRENEINFYVNNMIDDSLKNEKGITKDKFIENFKKQLENYKDKAGNYTFKEFAQVENQLSDVKIEGKKLIFDLDITVIKSFKGFSVSYLYNKKFEKIIGEFKIPMTCTSLKLGPYEQGCPVSGTSDIGEIIDESIICTPSQDISICDTATINISYDWKIERYLVKSKDLCVVSVNFGDGAFLEFSEIVNNRYTNTNSDDCGFYSGSDSKTVQASHPSSTQVKLSFRTIDNIHGESVYCGFSETPYIMCRAD